MDRHLYRVLCCVGLCIGMELAGSSVLAGARHNPDATLLIVPARPRIVQLAFDLAAMRPTVILSYRKEARGVEPLLFVWKDGAWQYISPDDFRERRFVTESPRQVIMIGDEQTLPAMLEDEAAWGAEVTRFKTLNIADLLNGINPLLRFTDREWKWLAARYDLTLTDINEPRRKYNPYDIPRSKLPLKTKAFEQGEGDTPPAVLIESPAKVSAPAELSAPATLPKAREPSLK